MSATTELRADTESPKRHAMLEAAASLFMAHGYGAVSMDAVARAAGVSKATLYAHFSSKEQLFATIIGDACRQKIALGDELLPADAADVRSALTGFGGRLLRFFLEARPLALHRVVIGESPRFPELGRAFYDNGPKALIGMFAAWLAEQTRAGRLAAHDPAMAAEQFVAMLRTSPFLRASLGLGPVTEAEIDATVAAAVTTFVKAYAPG
ncbi:MAG TPA: TetR/AcrR family transcriptional regulator [Acetobacteraceae bacterium]|nr:TetR/AcrR family transcriptional regulator [Acetobacteraceae bacterium]